MASSGKNVVLCPFCGGTRVVKSHRRGIVESALLRLVWLRPYRCIDCYTRFYRPPRPISPQQPDPVPAADHPKPPPETASTQTTIPIPTERRSFSRQRCQIPASITITIGSRWRIDGLVSGISLSGCFFETPKNVALGSQVELFLDVGQGARSSGIVRRLLQSGGMGIQFIGTTAANFRRLQHIASRSVRLH